MERHIAEFSMADLVERASVSMLPLAEKKNIDLQSFVDPAVPVLRQDAGKLQQVLYNLLSNAVKFTPEGGRIRSRPSPRPKIAWTSSSPIPASASLSKTRP